MNLKIAILAGACCLLGMVPALHADSLTVTLTLADQTVVQGTTEVDFYATISAPNSNTDTLYLNGDSFSTSSLLVTLDDSLYFANAPLSLDPGASIGPLPGGGLSASPFEIFIINLDPTLGPGLYTGTFSILGGADGGAGTAFDDLADANFSVDVTAPVPTPEPATLPLLGTGLVSLGVLRRRFSWSRSN